MYKKCLLASAPLKRKVKILNRMTQALANVQPFKGLYHKIIKHTQTVCLSVFDHFMGASI